MYIYIYINLKYNIYIKKGSPTKNVKIQAIKNYPKKGGHTHQVPCHFHQLPLPHQREMLWPSPSNGNFFAVAVDVATTTILGTNISPTKALLKMIFFLDARSDRRWCLTDLRRCVVKTKIGLEQGFWKTQRCNRNLRCAIVTVVGLNLNPNTSQRCCEDQNIMQLSEKIRTNLKVRMGGKRPCFPTISENVGSLHGQWCPKKAIEQLQATLRQGQVFSGIVLVQCTWMISGNPSIMGHNMVWILALESLV